MRRLGVFRPILSGCGLALSFPGFSLFPLAWIALVPLLDYLIEQRTFRSRLLGHFLMSFLYFGGVLYWIPRVMRVHGHLDWLSASGVFGLLLLVLTLMLLPFTLLTGWVASKSPERALVCIPGFWLLTELFRNYFAVNGFPWAVVGCSQFPFKLIIQIADLGGVYLVSWLVVASNCALLGLIRYGRRSPAVRLFVVACLLSLFYGGFRYYGWVPNWTPAQRIALVQGNIALAESREYYARKYFEDLPRLLAGAAESGAGWVVFPEAQNPFPFPNDFYFTTFWQKQARQQGVYVLLNAFTQESGEAFHYFNAAFQIDPDGEIAYEYRKVHLVPFGEYLPLAEWLTFASPLVREVSSFTPGSEYALGEVDGTQFGTLICYEAIFPEMGRAFARTGAKLLVNITNDAWFGETAAAAQHFEMAAFRAVEVRRPLLRAANTGYSAVVDPWGNISGRTSLFTEDVVVADVQGNSDSSVFTAVGDGPALTLIIVSVMLGSRRRGGGAV